MPKTYSLHVKNLHDDISVKELREAFEKFGEIRDVHIPRDYYTKRPKGFGFVECVVHLSLFFCILTEVSDSIRAMTPRRRVIK